MTSLAPQRAAITAVWRLGSQRFYHFAAPLRLTSVWEVGQAVWGLLEIGSPNLCVQHLKEFPRKVHQLDAVPMSSLVSHQKSHLSGWVAYPCPFYIQLSTFKKVGPVKLFYELIGSPILVSLLAILSPYLSPLLSPFLSRYWWLPELMNFHLSPFLSSFSPSCIPSCGWTSMTDLSLVSLLPSCFVCLPYCLSCRPVILTLQIIGIGWYWYSWYYTSWSASHTHSSRCRSNSRNSILAQHWKQHWYIPIIQNP